MRVLVCGGRNYDDRDRLRTVLEKLHAEAGVDVLINGGAKGADLMAHAWAGERGIQRELYEAEWDTHGSFAGPMRNKRMLDEGQPDLVIAFPGGRGTANMVKQARKAGVQVVEIAP